MLTYSRKQLSLIAWCRSPKDPCRQVAATHPLSQDIVPLIPHPGGCNDENGPASVSRGVQYQPRTIDSVSISCRVESRQAGHVFYIHHGSETTTWIRPITRHDPSSPPPPVAHVSEREHRSTRDFLRILGTAGIVGILYVLIWYAASFVLFIFLCLRRFTFSVHPSTTVPYFKG